MNTIEGLEGLGDYLVTEFTLTKNYKGIITHGIIKSLKEIPISKLNVKFIVCDEIRYSGNITITQSSEIIGVKGIVYNSNFLID